MPNSRPAAAELVEAVREFLEREVLPSLTGDRRFQGRVAMNVLGIVARELELGPAADRTEHAALAALLDRGGPLDELRRTLAERIRDGHIDADRDDILAYVRATLRDALAINNPKWLGQEPMDPSARSPAP
jgi:hypothetical protein